MPTDAPPLSAAARDDIEFRMRCFIGALPRTHDPELRGAERGGAKNEAGSALKRIRSYAPEIADQLAAIYSSIEDAKDDDAYSSYTDARRVADEARRAADAAELDARAARIEWEDARARAQQAAVPAAVEAARALLATMQPEADAESEPTECR